MTRACCLASRRGTCLLSLTLTYRAFDALRGANFSNGRSLSVAYDNRMRPTQWKVAGVFGFNYSYDYFNERTGRVTYAQNTDSGASADPTLDRSYEYDHVGRLVVAHSGAWTRGSVHLGGQLLAVQQAGAVSFVHEDPITKSKRATNSAGSVVSAVELDPYGADTSRSSNAAFQPRRFTTYEPDGNGGDEATHRRFDRRHARFDQRVPQVCAPLVGLARRPLAGALIVAGHIQERNDWGRDCRLSRAGHLRPGDLRALRRLERARQQDGRRRDRARLGDSGRAPRQAQP